VLVVEDNDDSRAMLRELLGLLGHEVHEAADGREGLEMALTLRPDVALVDLGLPGLDGFEVARQLRAADERRTMLLVAVTGYGRDEDRVRSREAGFDHHLVKPVDPEALHGILLQESSA
jgi:CheY-like chemotaxis protein